MEKDNLKTKGVKGLAVVGAVAVFLLAGWGAVSVVRAFPTALSNLGAAAVTLSQIFIPSSEELEINIDSTVVDSGTPFTFTWEHTGNRDEGHYLFTYSCDNGVVVDVANAEGVFSAVACEGPVSLGEAKSLTLRAVSNEVRFADVTVGIAFENNDEEITVSDNITLTVVSDGETEETTDEEEEVVTPVTPPRGNTEGEQTDDLFEITPGTESPVVSDPNGRVDFIARILEVGVVDLETNEFTATSSVHASDRVAVQFEIENLGTKTSGPWDFTAVLPTKNIYFFNSPTQQALAPGDRIEFTLGFDGVKAQDAVFRVNVDPGNEFGEASEDNNIVEVEITVIEE